MLNYHRMALRDAPAVVRALCETFPDARRFADVGCGSGAYAAQLKRSGRAVIACEHAPGGRFVARTQGVKAVPFELDEQPPARFAGGVDLAYSFEVAEHCTPDQGDRLVEFLAKLAPVIVFTAAHPEQGGLGHINEQPQSYWIERFAQHGAVHDPLTSSALATSFNAHGVDAFWFAENVMVFNRD